MAQTRGKLYWVWAAMVRRCNNPNVNDYPNYGGRGIRVCERWRLFANFFADMGNSYFGGLTLDRVDTNGNYEPKNCRWVTRKVQCNNKRNNRVVDFRGRSMNITQWASELGIKPSTVRQRFYVYRWPIEKCLTVKI